LATRPGDINANVGVELNQQGMAAALNTLQKNIDGIITALNKAGAAAEAAVGKGGKAGQEAAGQISRQLRTLQQLKQTQRNTLFGDQAELERIGKAAVSTESLRRGLEQGAAAAQKLSTRMVDIQTNAGRILRGGNQLPANYWDRFFQLDGVTKTHKQIERSYQQTLDRMTKLSPKGQQALSADFAQLTQLRNSFTTMAGDNRTGPQLNVNLRQQEEILRRMQDQTREIAKQESEANGLLRSTQLRADAILGQTRAMREQDLRAGANRYSTYLAGRSGGGQFSQYLPGLDIQNMNLRTKGLETTARLTNNLLNVEKQLTSARQRDTSQERLDQLIRRRERLLDLQKQSLAVGAAENRPGFFGGIKEGFNSVAHGPGGAGGGLGGVGNLIGRVGAFTAAYQAIGLVTGALQQGIGFAIEFEDQLAQLQAISGATSTEMTNLSNSILAVSQNSANSISEITQSAQIIAQAGYSAQETSQLLQNVVNLSAASGASPADSVDIMTSAMGAFQLQVSDSTHITDALVTTLNDTKLAANQVQLGLQYLGATAKENNLTFEDLIAVLGTAADAGIRSGSTMATGTRQLLIDLQDPTKKLVAELDRIGLTMGDVDVKTRGIIPVLQALRENGFNAFGAIETRAAAMYQVLANNTEEMERLRSNTLRQGTAAEAAAKRLDSFSAQWNMVKNNTAAAGKAFGDLLLPFLTGVLKQFVSLMTAIGDFNKMMNDATLAVGNFFNYNKDGEPLIYDLGKALGIAKEEARGFSGSLDEQVTALNEAEAATKAQKDSINSLDEEAGNLVTRYDSLTKSQSQTGYEVDRLSQRFPGLRAEFDKTKGGIDGLIQAVFRLREEMQKTLLSQAYQELSKGTLTAEAQRDAVVGTARDLSNKYGDGGRQLQGVAAQQQKILQLLIGNYAPGEFKSREAARSEGQRLLSVLVANQNIDRRTREEFLKDMQSLSSAQGAYGSTLGSNRRNRTFIAEAEYYNTVNGGLFKERTLRNESDANRIISGTNGRTMAQRQAAVAPEIKKVEDDIANLLVEIDNLARSGQTAAFNAAKELLRVNRVTLRNLKGAAAKTEDEIKEDKKNERGTPRQRDNRTNAQAFADFEAQLRARGITRAAGRTGYRSAADQNEIYRTQPGATPLDGYRRVSRHQSYEALDPTRASHDDTKAYEAARAAGLTGFKIVTESGGRKHYEWKGHDSVNGTSTDINNQERDAEREAEEQARQELRIAQANLAARKRTLDVQTAALEDVEGGGNVVSQLASIEEQFKLYREDRLAVARKEAARQKMSAPEEQELLAATNAELDQMWKQTIQKAADAIEKVMTKMVNDRVKMVEDAFNNRLRPAQTLVDRQNSVMTGLNLPQNAGRVPEYTKVIQQQRIDQANAALSKAQIPALQDRITGLRSILQNVEEGQAALARTNPLLAQMNYASYSQAVADLKDKIDGAVSSQQQLIDQSQAVGMAPQNWSQAWGQATQAWQIQNQGGLSYTQRLMNGLGDGLESIHGSFQQFFVDIVSGTMSVGKAFGNMAKAVMSALMEMLAKAAATQIFSMILGFVGGGGNPFAAGASGGGFSIPFFTGGLVQPKSSTPPWGQYGMYYNGGPIGKYAGGGLISAGIPTRDTVPILASKGEFMMRRSAVEDIGHNMLMDMNNRGGAALEKLASGGGTVINQQPAETNVYVVMPEEKPTLGPNDVLAIVSNDVLRGGATKALIKSVKAGG